MAVETYLSPTQMRKVEGSHCLLVQANVRIFGYKTVSEWVDRLAELGV